jgi:serine protease Do
VEVKALRNGKEKTFRVTLKQMPDEAQAAVGKRESAEEDSDALNGVEVGDITPAARRQFDLPNRLQGALITNVDPDSASYEAGLRQGDVLQEIDRKPVKNAEEAVEISKHVKTKKTLVLVWSHGTSSYVMVDEGKAK